MGSFTIALEKFAEKAEKNAETATRKITLDVFRGVIMKTPVASGRARGNWQANIGSSASGEVDAEDKSGAVTVVKAAAECATWNPAAGPIFLTNNLPYIERLENGYSKQAPAGMVAVTIAEFGGIADDAAQEVNR